MGPARTLRSDAERNRRLVLEAATEAFAEEGLDVGMAEIARRAGVGNATVFRRFPSKDALIEAIAALQARDRGFFQATEQFLLSHPDLLRRHLPILEAVEPLVARAQAAG